MEANQLWLTKPSKTVVICPGIHSTTLTESFLVELQSVFPDNNSVRWLVFPSNSHPPYSPLHVLDFLQQQLKTPLLSHPSLLQGCLSHRLRTMAQEPLIMISFSAGVVGAIGAAQIWQSFGGVIQCFIALDGWGVPLWGNFPIHRISHDYFTHWSSAFLGAGQDSFYANPPVDHLELWRSPHTVTGWRIAPSVADYPSNGLQIPQPTPMTAVEFLLSLLNDLPNTVFI